MPTVVEQFLEHVRLAFDRQHLVKLTLGDTRGPDATLRNVYVRRVELRAGSRMSVCFRHTTRDVTRNLEPHAALAEISALLGTAFGGAHLFTTQGEVQLCWPVGSEPRMRTRPASRPAPVSNLHDRARSRLIEAHARWLHGLGVTTAEGRVRADMTAKFRQIHRFVEILGHCLAGAEPTAGSRTIAPLARGADGHVRGDLQCDDGGQARLCSAAGASPPDGLSETDVVVDQPVADRPPPTLRLVDMGCGKGYLTFAAHDWLRRTGWAPEVLGVESRAELVESCNRVVADLGWGGLSFRQGTIAETHLEPADILVALHACDTATDDAIAKGIQAGVRLILVAPCCHRELRPQLRPPPALAPAFRHGIFRERQAEFVTDALRAALLEWAGYQTRVFEFIAADHTAKNLMIAATRRTAEGGRADRAAAVRELAEAYGIRSQALARRLGFTLGAPTPPDAGTAIGSSASRR